MNKLLAIPALTAIAMSLPLAAAHADPLTIRVGWQGPPEKIIPMLAHRHDLAPHEGTSYTVQSMHFEASSAEITALATNDLDLATLGYSSFGLAIENAHLDDLRIVADVYQDGGASHFSTRLMVRKDSGIDTIEGLKGKVLAANGPGSGGDMAIRQMLRVHHLEEKKDYTLISGPPLNQFPMLYERKADLVTISVPQAYDEKVEATAKTLFSVKDALGTTQWSLYAMRKGFIEKNRTQLGDFFADMLHITRWMLDPAHRDEMIQLMSAFTRQPPSAYGSYLFSDRDFYRDPNGVPNLDALQSNLQTMKSLGFMKTDVDVHAHADLSLIAEAKQRQ
jgi:NitT/TauT family transport system substrate-binding protein